MSTVGVVLPGEIERVAELRALYLSVPNGIIAATMMTVALDRAKKAIAECNVLEQIRALEDLRGFTE